MTEETVTISKKFYEELIENDLWVRALGFAGVDNWDGYDFAKETYQELVEEARERSEKET